MSRSPCRAVLFFWSDSPGLIDLTPVPATVPAPELHMHITRSFGYSVLITAVLHLLGCAIEESDETDVGSGDRSDAYNGEPIFEVLAEDNPNLVCCCVQSARQCDLIELGGRRSCRASVNSCPGITHSRLEANNRRDIIVDGCPVWEVIDYEQTRCIPADAGSRDDVRRDP